MNENLKLLSSLMLLFGRRSSTQQTNMQVQYAKPISVGTAHTILLIAAQNFSEFVKPRFAFCRLRECVCVCVCVCVSWPYCQSQED